MNNTSIKYEAVLDICDRINSVVRDLNDQFERINSLSNSMSGFWKGTAANKFYDEIRKKYKEVPDVTEKTLPLYLETIKEIVEQNRATDSEINAEQIAKLGFSIPTISPPVLGEIKTKKISSVDKENVGKVKTTTESKTSIGTIDMMEDVYPKNDGKKTQTPKATTEEIKNMNEIGDDISNIKQTSKTLDGMSNSNNTTSGTISLSQLLKFIK